MACHCTGACKTTGRCPNNAWTPSQPSGYLGGALWTVGSSELEKNSYIGNKINVLSQSLGAHESLITHCQHGIDKLFDRIEALEKRIADLEKKDYCPKCKGKGYNEYYVNGENAMLKTPVRCSPCKGSGIVVKA